MAQFKIWSAEVTWLGPVGVVIATAFTNAGGYPRAESFLLLPDNQTFFAKKLKFDVKSFEESPVELNEELMLGEALQQAKNDLGVYFESRIEAGGFTPPPDSPNVAEANINLLVHVWIRGTCSHLREVHKKTEYEPLAEAIRPILGLPIMHSEKL